MKKNSSRKSNRLAPKKTLRDASALTQKYADTVLAPLARREASVATKLALEAVLRDGVVKRDRVRIYRPSLRIEKPKQRDGAPRRMIWVRIRDRDRGIVHEISIEDGKLAEHVPNAHANPPLSDEERSDACELISADPHLGKLTKRPNVAIEWLSAKEHSKGRVIGARLVRLQKNRVVEIITEATVELDKGALYKGRRHE